MPQCESESPFFDSSLPFPLEAEEHEEELNNDAHHADEGNAWADQLTQLLARVQPLAAPSDAFALQLLEDTQVLSRLLARDDRPADVVVLATRLAAVGYGVVVRTAIGGGDACFRNLHNEFLCVVDSSSGRRVEYICEPAFRTHFKISSPSPLYAALYEQLPAEFVGTAAQLTPLVQLLCSEMHASFKQQGLTLPPWRQARSMLSKWLPSRSRDMPAVVPSGQPAATAAAAEALHPLSLAGTSQQHRHEMGEQHPTAGGSSDAATSSPLALKKSLLAGRLHLAPAKSLPPNMTVTPSPFRGQPPTYKVRIGV